MEFQYKYQETVDWLRQQLAAEKKRRMHYQHIVYNVCNMLDQIDGRHPGNGIVCGTAEEPHSDIETRIQQLTAERDSLRKQLSAANAEIERLSIQLAACGVAANANTWESAAEMRLNDKSPYWSESYSDVCNAVNREIEHRGAATVLAKEREELREQLAAANANVSDLCGKLDYMTAYRDGLHQRLVTEQQQLAAEREANRWIPVSERLPTVSGNT